MLFKILQFELKYRLNRPATYIYFSIFLLISFLIIGLPESTITGAADKLNRNAPEIIGQLMIAFMIYGSIVIAAVMGVPVYRDYEHNIDEIMFSLPVKRMAYLWGKFIGSFLVSVFIFSGLFLGILLGNIMPWHEADTLGPFRIAAYIQPFVVYVIPNIFIVGALFFVIGSTFRSHVAIYAQGVLFVVLYFLINILMGDVDANPIYGMFEPFGSMAAAYTTKYWTTFERNTMLIPFEGIILWNRLAWVTFSAIISIIYILNSKPYRFAGLFIRRKSRKEAFVHDGKGIVIPLNTTTSGGLKTSLGQWWHMAVFNFKHIVVSIPFVVLMGCGVGFMALARFGMSMYGTPSLPVTYMLLDTLVGGFMIFLVVVIIVYSGELIWKDINTRFAPIVDASPVSNRLVTLSKFMAMILVQLTMLLVIVLSGIGVQLINGFYDFQLQVYAKSLLLNTFPYLVLITFITFFVHSLINNKFLGHGIMVAFYAINIISSQLGLRHILFKYGDSLSEPYSGMNGFQKFIFPILTLDFYWLMLGIIFLAFSIFLIKRGNDIRFAARLKYAFMVVRQRQNIIVLSTAFILFVATGSFIYYNTNVLNEYRTKKEDRWFKAEYEKTYSKYMNYPKPRIIDVNVNVDIYPRSYGCKIKGHYALVNKNDSPIDTIHLRVKPEAELMEVSFDRIQQGIHEAKHYGYYMYAFPKAILPGDTVTLDFEIEYQEKGFTNWGRGKRIIPNGTYFINQVLPYFGYDEGMELKDKKGRKKEGLPEKEFETADLYDSTAYHDTYISPNADRINYEALMSTAKGQTALTCGKLQKQWVEDDRAYFHYKMELPMWNLIPFLSAKYEVVTEKYNGTQLSIYYHEGHGYNLEKMMKAMKQTLDYCEQHFSGFQHDALKIVEFPRYRKFAQSFSGIIPFSEGVGFITDVDSKKDIDVPFYVTSHEVAHQWWGHQVAPADVKGKLMLIESMANYTALMVMEKEYGKTKIRDFLKYEQDLYLMGRAVEKKKEVPLYLVDNQTYVAYRKGSVMFYQLKDFIGEKYLNNALAGFIRHYAFREAPYPTSIDFMDFISKEIPDSLNYLIDDLFKSITLFSNRIDSTEYKELDNGLYKVTVHATIQKFKSDSIGKQEEVDPNGWIDVGVFTKADNGEDSLMCVEMVPVKDKNLAHEMRVASKPIKAGIDPMYKIIDRNLLDNVKAVKAE